MPATVVPTSMAIAEVGPMANWRDVPNERIAETADQIAINSIVRRQAGE